ncbi:MAG: methyltransferase domain-containing protein [Candidatus Pacebacteria bacterium]|nr:methyltransferase domain-containing protein [Candidatus Paceibacterota bacterium]
MQHLDKQHQYFSFAYQTGSDIWSHIPYRFKAEEMFPKLESDSLILDIGAGRGLWAMNLLRHNYRVLGIDYVESIVNNVNNKINEEGYGGKARFIVGNALSIPFTDGGFDAATDIGTFQHIKKQDWKTYVKEIHRVLKSNRYYLNVSLSRRTHSFLGFKPSQSHTGDFEKFGVHYYFCTEQEIDETFNTHFNIIEQQYKSFESKTDPMDDLVLVFTLMQKK